ncbi:MAG: amino acid ABC transporter permease [Actinomycetota bacterium]
MTNATVYAIGLLLLWAGVVVPLTCWVIVRATKARAWGWVLLTTALLVLGVLPATIAVIVYPIRAHRRVPFRVWVAIVWIEIFVILATVFLLAGFDLPWMREYGPYIAKGLWVTILIAVCSIILTVPIALLGALGRLSRNPIAYGVSGFYTSFFRGTPLIVQLFLIYLAVPQLVGGLGLPETIEDIFTFDAVVAGIIGISLCYGAYMTEIFRAGIESVSHGQREAAEALGMSYRQTMRRVVLPQATRVIIPPTGNEFIAMLKDTALVSFLGATLEFTESFRLAQLYGKAEFKNLEAYVLVAGMYWILTAVFSFFQRKLEKRFSRGYVRAAAEKAAEGGLMIRGPISGQPGVP